MHPFEKKLACAWPPQNWCDVTVLVAVSGGPDSVALLRGLAASRNSAGVSSAGGTLRAAHLNHQLRGADAAADEQFVVELCRCLAIPCEVGRADDIDNLDSSGGGLEAAARQARYRFLESVAERHGARYVVVAHTADDQAETILHRMVRGTGISGLRGMARARPIGPATLLRPLLAFRRDELLEYLADIGQSFQIDSTNTDRRFTRNRLRHELIPHLVQQYNPQVVDALLRLGTHAGELHEWVDQQVEAFEASCVQHVAPDGQGVWVDTRQLASKPAAMVRELFINLWRRQGWPMQQMGFEQWNLLAEMAYAAGRPSSLSRKHTFPGRILAEAGPEGLVLVPPLP